MASPSTLSLLLLTFLQLSRNNVLAQQITESISEITLPSPASSLPNSYGIIRYQNHPLFQVLTQPQAGSNAQRVYGLTYEDSNHLLQIPGNGFIGQLPVKDTIPSSVALYFTGGKSTSDRLQNTVSLNPVVQSTMQVSQSAPTLTNFQLQPGLIASSSSLPENQYIVPSSFPNNNGFFGSTDANFAQTSVQRPSISASEHYSKTPDFTQSYIKYNVPDKNVPTTILSNTPQVGSSMAINPLTFTGTPAFGFGSNLLNKGMFSVLPSANYVDLQTLLKDSAMTSGGTTVTATTNEAAALQTQGVQTQTVQIPCILNIVSPVPITVNQGASQISTTLPMQQQVIPSSFIDQSPPTISILRPPSSFDSDNIPIDVISTPTTYPLFREPSYPSGSNFITDSKGKASLLTTTINEHVKQTTRSQDSQDLPIQNGELPFSEIESDSAPDLARNSFPLMYAVLPQPISLQSSSIPDGGAPARKKVKGPSSSRTTPRPAQGNNPFFSVNKRKHFEYYQYF